jgi:hypothetical protein
MLKDHLHRLHFGGRYLAFGNCFHLYYHYELSLNHVCLSLNLLLDSDPQYSDNFLLLPSRTCSTSTTLAQLLNMVVSSSHLFPPHKAESVWSMVAQPIHKRTLLHIQYTQTYIHTFIHTYRHTRTR